jgi:hypothetical protein
MNHSSTMSFILIGASVITGCATGVDPKGTPEKTSTSIQSVTLADCASQRDACFANNPLIGVFVCPAQFTQCTLTANNGLPAQVNQAITDAAACNNADRECTAAARTPAQVAACARTQAECVASIVQVPLPSIVTGTATCIQNTVRCINAAEAVADLTTCANDLSSCAVTQVQTVVPPAIGNTIGNINSCRTALNSCIVAATTPAQVRTCTQTEATCVASGLGITLPDVSIPGVVQCAQAAASCTLKATTVRSLAACANGLNSCTAEAGLPTPPPLTCAQKWTACLAENPFNFPLCDSQLLTCTP